MASTPGFTLPLLEWISIPAGNVTLEKGWVGKDYDYEKDYSHELLATYQVAPFSISKYPVTVAQFQAFTADGGYADDRWWQGLADRPQAEKPPEGDGDAGDNWFQQGWQAGWWRSVAWDKERPWSEGDCPQSVSWYKAMAFCRWLSDKLGASVTLPTEMQWQRAAQGDDGREYPWGEAFDNLKCNIRESGIHRTTPVNHYPLGASPYWVMDMAGNLNEWCLNKYENPLDTDVGGTDSRALRGSTYLVSYQGSAACAYRYLSVPGSSSDLNGFRLVMVPRSSLCT